MRESTKRRAPRLTARVQPDPKTGAMRGALHIYDAVGGWDGVYAKDVVAKLDELRDQGAKHLDVHINSPGGDVFEGMAIHTAIKGWSSGEKRVHVDGLAASMASIVAMAGDEICIAPTAMIMVHNPRGFAMGEAGDLRKVADRLDAIRGVMVDVYAKRTGLEAKELETMCDAETWMSADEAVKKGFADQVVERDDDDDEEEEDDDEGSLAQALAQFKRPPPHIERLLNLTLPVASSTSAATPQENNAMKNWVPMCCGRNCATDSACCQGCQCKASCAAICGVDVPPEPPANASADAAVLAAKAFAATGPEKTLSAVQTATGKATIGEAVAMIAGLKEKASKADELAAQLAKVASEKRAGEIKAMLDEASKDGRLSPAQRAKLTGAERPAFAKDFDTDPAALKSYLDELPKLTGSPAAAPVASGDPAVTPEVEKIATQLGLDPKVVAKRQAELKR